MYFFENYNIIATKKKVFRLSLKKSFKFVGIS